MILNCLTKLAAGGAIAAALGVSAFARDCPSEPQFVSQSGGNREVAAAATRVERGEWRAAEAFAWRAADGASDTVKGAAYVNLCAALAMREGEQIMAVCDAGVALSQEPWRALNNRGAARWLAGEYDAAAEDFAAAAEAAGGAPAVQNNLALADCAAR